MTHASFNFMPLDRQLFDRSIGEVLSAMLRQKYRTAKHLARTAGIAVPTAENAWKGVVSLGTLQKILVVEGRDLWNKLGDELYGESFFQFEQRRLDAIIREAEHAKSNLVRLDTEAARVLAGAGLLVAADLGPTPSEIGTGEGRSWAPADRSVSGDAESQGPDTEVAARAHGGAE